MPVNFDATVTIQTMIYALVILVALFTFATGAVGAKLFQSKESAVKFEEGIGRRLEKFEQLFKDSSYEARTAMQSQVDRILSAETERSGYVRKDLERIEKVCSEALEEARSASSTARDAMHAADLAQKSSDRSEKLVDGLMTRQREGDSRR